jgi:hypothetical protein
MTVVAAAGLAVEARGQEVMRVSYSWSEVVAGTLTPVASPNSVLEPGEGARIGLNIFATRNGVDAIGQTTTYPTPPPPGVGTVRGVGSFIYNLNGDNGSSSCVGTWSNRAISPLLSVGAFGGTILNGGATLDSLGGGVFLAPGQTANGTNPIVDAFRGVWTPNSYTSRTVIFRASGSAGPSGQWNSIVVQYGSGLVDPTDPTTEYALYVTKYLATDFTGGVVIPISPVPGPGVACVIGVGAAWLIRRKRTP